MVNKNVLSCLLKDGKEVNAVMLVGRLNICSTGTLVAGRPTASDFSAALCGLTEPLTVPTVPDRKIDAHFIETVTLNK